MAVKTILEKQPLSYEHGRINDLLSKHKNKQANINLYDGKLITDPISVANKFNVYFTTIGPKLSDKVQNLGQHFSSYMPPKSDKSFYLSPTTPAEIALEIKTLSESTSSDIPIKLIKIVSKHISNVLSHIFNHSFETGDYPEKLQFAKVTPAHKAVSPYLAKFWK